MHCSDERDIKHVEKLTPETVHAHLAVFASSSEAAVAKAHAGNWTRVSGESALAFTGPGIPDLDHAIFSTSHDAQRISGEGPDTFQMPEEGAEAAARRGLPQTNGRVQGAVTM